jgi:hypothetical protein
LQSSCQRNYSATSSQPPLQSSTELDARILLLITPCRGSLKQHPVSYVACVTVTAGTYLPSRCPGKAVLLLLRSCMLRALSSNGSCL